MRRAEDFREIAWEALRGKWKLAALTALVAALIGAAAQGGPSIDMVRDPQASELWGQLRPFMTAGSILLGLWGLAAVVIGGAGRLGYAIFNLKLVDGEEASLHDLFSQFHRLWQGFCMTFLVGLFTVLWCLLLVIPGIIKSYSYAMTPYILAEHPEMSALGAITESRRIMDGSKRRLFCLGLSFIGWGLLCAAPLLIALWTLGWPGALSITPGDLTRLIPAALITFAADLFLRSYTEAAYAAFYRDVSRTGGENIPYVG